MFIRVIQNDSEIKFESNKSIHCSHCSINLSTKLSIMSSVVQKKISHPLRMPLQNQCIQNLNSFFNINEQ